MNTLIMSHSFECDLSHMYSTLSPLLLHVYVLGQTIVHTIQMFVRTASLTIFWQPLRSIFSQSLVGFVVTWLYGVCLYLHCSNYTLKTMPVPLNDAATLLTTPDGEQLIQRVCSFFFCHFLRNGISFLQQIMYLDPYHVWLSQKPLPFLTTLQCTKNSPFVLTVERRF